MRQPGHGQRVEGVESRRAHLALPDLQPASAVARDVGFRQLLTQLYMGDGMCQEDAIERVNGIAVLEIAGQAAGDHDDDGAPELNDEQVREHRIQEMDFEDPTTAGWNDDELLDYIQAKVSKCS